MSMTQKTITPLALNQTNQCAITPPWFVDRSEYHILPAGFKPLVNGKETFEEVYRAIEKAKQSVCIICWGFQPSMYFIRDGQSLRIGELLEKKAFQGVKVRVLSYAVNPLHLKVNITGKAPGESNLPGRHVGALNDRPAISSDDQYRYDQEWFFKYDDQQVIADDLVKRKLQGMSPQGARNLWFTSRGFTVGQRKEIASRGHLDKGLASMTKATLAATPSHHQKMVLVDYEDPNEAIGFVMGHNMLDEYWDTDQHSYLSLSPSAARFGRNSNRPRQDISSRVCGPIVGDLFSNFAQAWQEETKEALPARDFQHDPIRDAKPLMAQLLRTQPQYGVQDIKKLYLQTVNNATQYIYIENQYFRWPPLAEIIKTVAQSHTKAGRCPERHGALHLFVVTNADDESVKSGAINTYRMLDSLGRADTIPNVAREHEVELREAELSRARAEQKRAEEAVNRSAARAQARSRSINAHFDEAHMKLLEEAQKAQRATVEAEKALKATEEAVAKAKKQGNVERRPIVPKMVPGLKMHVCTLVAPDSPPGKEWVDVYVHSKLMLIDDTFMTLGSANINTRSMEVDSELNIALDRPEVTRVMRQRLWQMHTRPHNVPEEPADAFKVWGDIIQQNKSARENKIKGKPTASLIEFYRDSPARGNLD